MAKQNAPYSHSKICLHLNDVAGERLSSHPPFLRCCCTPWPPFALTPVSPRCCSRLLPKAFIFAIRTMTTSSASSSCLTTSVRGFRGLSSADSAGQHGRNQPGEAAPNLPASQEEHRLTLLEEQLTSQKAPQSFQLTSTNQLQEAAATVY